MNPPPISAAATPSVQAEPQPTVPALAAGERLLPTGLAVGALVILGDYLFWSHGIGLSLAIFVSVLAGLLVVRNRSVARTPQVGLTLLLLLPTVVQIAIEISFTNLAVTFALLAILLAELRYLQLPRGWSRWSESLVAWAGALGRWFWLFRALGERPTTDTSKFSLGHRLARVARVAFPAVLLTVVFIIIFAMGNSIFHRFFNQGINQIYRLLEGFDFEPSRVIFWLFLATVSLAFIRPRDGATESRQWAGGIREWRRSDAGVAYWQSVSILLALNLLFFAVNTIDVVYLWQRTALPEGVLPRDYLYAGVYSMITATVLAGVVLTMLFQQSPDVVGARGLRVLAYAWIAQNFVLISGVFLRLKLFLEVADITEKRVYVACFLLLVTVGFALVCVHVARGRQASRLVWWNVVATFGLFFVLQFLNVSDWVARQNFARAESTSTGVNVPYNMNLGAASWVALMEIAQRLPAGGVREELILDLRERAYVAQMQLVKLDWRERQWRRDRNAAAIVEWAKEYPELTGAERKSSAIQRMYETENRMRRGVD